MKYIYNENSNIYTVTDSGKMKSGNGWVVCIIYKNEQGEIFVREKSDFDKKFTTFDKESPLHLGL